MDKLIGGYSPEAFEKPLHEYQCTAVNWQLNRLFLLRRKGCALFLDPGLGKTRITLTLLDMLFKLGEIRRVLVLAPLRPIYTVWRQEMKRWGFPQSSIILHEQHALAMGYNMQIELLNYNGLKKVCKIKNRWDIVIFDESTMVKNESDRTNFAKQLVLTVPRRIVLTGTPAANCLSDLYNQMYIIDDGLALGRTVGNFRARFCRQGGWYGRKWTVRVSQREELQEAIRHDVLYMDAKDYLDMPELVEHDIHVQMPKQCLIEYNRLKRELVAQVAAGTIFAKNASSAYMKCRQMAGGQVYDVDEEGNNNLDAQGERAYHVVHKAKIQALTELYEECGGKPLLVFYNFSHELKQLKKQPQFRRAPVINGKTKGPEAEKIIRDWNKGIHAILFIQWQSGSHGINMQESCNDIACFGLTDMPEVYKQAIRRVWRQGVKGFQVRVHRLLTEGTVDFIQAARLSDKCETEADFLRALKQHGLAA